MRKLLIALLCTSFAGAAVPALAGDGADSPASIAKYTKAMLGKHPCALKSGEIALTGSCAVKASGAKTSDGIATYALTGNPGQVSLTGVITPSLEGGSFAGERLCNSKGKPAVAYTGELKRKGKKLWQGELTPAARSPLCGPVTLILGK